MLLLDRYTLVSSHGYTCVYTVVKAIMTSSEHVYIYNYIIISRHVYIRHMYCTLETRLAPLIETN